ncbi:MAG: ATP-binding cassette domain-containing protein [Betaproteobacteria bacterium]|nr:ATP-binding cassette domain-containing protein [Betaproteobacteria bacterium]
MALITLQSAQLAFGDVPLLDHTALSIETGERIGLIGRNGTGKSSLLKILAGFEHLDDGVIQYQQGLNLAYVAQEPLLEPSMNVFDAVSVGLAPLKAVLEQYYAGEGDLNALQNQIELQDGWSWEQRVTETLQRLHLDGDALVGSLSGGTKKRVALGQALVTLPDILLLDEPTNHLDLDSIQWLEDLLIEFKGSAVVITHDRAFLDRVSTRIVELDRGHLHSYQGNFQSYLLLKEAEIAAEAVTQAKADKLLAQEEVWVRKGVEARRTRSVARIARLEKLRATRQARRNAMGQVKASVDAGLPSGKIVAELTDVSMQFGSKVVVNNFSATLLRGDKVGLVGPNGAGKTTLLKLILGELQASRGKVRQGANMQVAYFDQMRNALDLDATLEDFISPGSEWIEIGTQRQHVKSYLGDFLFSPARANSPVRTLSGGERNRLLLARLFARPANVLVLDEPTNDLDIDTLELLEELLQNYAGTVFLVSHDRAFLDNVVTSTIAYEGDAHWREYEGGVQDWLLQSNRAKVWSQKVADIQQVGGEKATFEKGPSASAVATTATAMPNATAPNPSKTAAKKLSFKEQREYDSLPALIEQLEHEQASLNQALADGSLYVSDPKGAATKAMRVAQIDDEMLAAMERLEALSQRAPAA